MTMGSDLIDRQAAIDALDGGVIVTSKESAQAVMDYIRGCADRIRSLPSAQPLLNQDQPRTQSSDYISRQNVIDAIVAWTVEDRPDAEMPTDLVGRINALPSAQQDLDEWCTDCKEYDKERNSCPRWNRVIRETLRDMNGARQENVKNYGDCTGCKHLPRFSHDEPCATCSRNYENKWDGEDNERA